MKRTYLLLAIAILQIILGSFTILGAAQPVQMSQDVLIPAGGYYHSEFGILGAGRLSGNLLELQGRSFDFFVFDDRGFASFQDGSNASSPLFERSGTGVIFDLGLAGSAQYHVVIVEFPSQQDLQVHLDLVVRGLKTVETVVALIVLAGGLALVGASLMLSVWAWRRAPATPTPSPSPDSVMIPSSDPSSVPSASPPGAAQDPPDDNTRIY